MENNRAKEIISEIDTLKTELGEIQSACDHVPILKFDNKLKTVVRCCEICDKLLGYPSEQELKDNGYCST